MKREHYIKALLSCFTNSLIPAIASNDPSMIEILRSCRCKVELNGDQPTIVFSLADIFEALWRQAYFQGIPLPMNSEWDKDFREFCKQLMNPWPDYSRESHGYRLQLVHRSNSYAGNIYELSPSGNRTENS